MGASKALEDRFKTLTSLKALALAGMNAKYFVSAFDALIYRFSTPAFLKAYLETLDPARDNPWHAVDAFNTLEGDITPEILGKVVMALASARWKAGAVVQALAREKTLVILGQTIEALAPAGRDAKDVADAFRALAEDKTLETLRRMVHRL